jgi:hypothetical protein
MGIICSLLIAHAKGQDNELVTDRPDQSNTPILVPKGALQIETGIVIEKDNAGHSMNYEYNSSLLKFGINSNFEARLAFGYLGVKSIPEATSLRGWSPFAVGMKIRLTDPGSAMPQAALISNVTLKSGTENFRPAHTCTDVTLALSQPIGSRLSVTMNGGIKWDGDSPEATVLYTITAGYSFTNNLSMFAESYGFFPESRKADHRADAGITYKIHPRVQYDASAGFGLSQNSPRYFVSTGLTVRLFK